MNASVSPSHIVVLKDQFMLDLRASVWIPYCLETTVVTFYCNCSSLFWTAECAKEGLVLIFNGWLASSAIILTQLQSPVKVLQHYLHHG